MNYRFILKKILTVYITISRENKKVCESDEYEIAVWQRVSLSGSKSEILL